MPRTMWIVLGVLAAVALIVFIISMVDVSVKG